MTAPQINVQDYVQALKDQRNEALDKAAEWQALAQSLRTELDQKQSEVPTSTVEDTATTT